MSQPDIIAAGAVVLRKGGAGKSSDVLLVHRPKYDDWSFAKGKLDRGEHVTACATREVREETGLDVRLGVPLPDQHYAVGNRGKVVHYWIAWVVGADDVSGYQPNDEIDEVRWVPLDEADELLTYPRDRETLAAARTNGDRTRTLVVLRHAHARDRARWRTDDRLRPLLKEGEAQAARLVPLLASYDVRRLVSSTSYRCVQTLVPYADATAREIETVAELSEEDATVERVIDVVDELIEDGKRTVVCTHRPVLPDVFFTLGLADPKLDPGQLLVVHHRKGAVVATETHHVR
ncbi:NUDIX hydrolase [Nocardioides sp. JQ2195]|uniref:NUDIX hydrolase n=1 Tax=Nocardioides sp. JQ2195 TaxID=2592334 RepID=UPI00143EB53B|nr:NUDIX hydrolase [Nocardioides sp. JQ2195]QIX25469.1 NUDIX hydrolase [Nocardioides sp. JQ2195]